MTSRTCATVVAPTISQLTIAMSNGDQFEKEKNSVRQTGPVHSNGTIGLFALSLVNTLATGDVRIYMVATKIKSAGSGPIGSEPPPSYPPGLEDSENALTQFFRSIFDRVT